MLHVAVQMFLFAVLCGIVVAQSDQKYHGDPDAVMFPGPLGPRTKQAEAERSTSIASDSDTSISIELARQINSINSAQEFLKMVQGVDPTVLGVLSAGTRSGFDDERSNAEMPVPAKCMPELQPVPLKPDNESGTIYYPTCARIKRCGGCCSHSLLSCQPTATEVRNFQVIVTAIDHGTGLIYKGKRIVPLEEHTKCKCDCRIKPEHCTEKQAYVPGECKCVCTNTDEAEKCLKNNDVKLWDPKLCTCLCRTIQDCSTGFYFDQNTCRCERKE